MKILAYLSNIAFIIPVLVKASDFDVFDAKEKLIMVLLFMLPVINLIALATSGRGRDLLSLYFERKRLEQEQMILAIRKSIGKET